MFPGYHQNMMDKMNRVVSELEPIRDADQFQVCLREQFALLRAEHPKIQMYLTSNDGDILVQAYKSVGPMMLFYGLVDEKPVAHLVHPASIHIKFADQDTVAL